MSKSPISQNFDTMSALVVDVASVNDLASEHRAIGRQLRDNDDNSSFGHLRRMVHAALLRENYGTQAEAANDLGWDQYASKYVQCSRLVEAIADQHDADQMTEQQCTEVQRIIDFLTWDAGMSVAETEHLFQQCRAADRETSVPAVERLTKLVSSVDRLYKVAKGTVLSEFDPAAVVEPTEPTTEPTEPTGGSTSWQELVTKGVRYGREQGASDDEIAAFVMELLK